MAVPYEPVITRNPAESVAAFACLDVRAINSHRPKTPWWPFSKEKKKRKENQTFVAKGNGSPQLILPAP
jgi:hypothetical protein